MPSSLRELLDAAQPLHVLLGVEAGVLRRTLGGDQAARLVDAKRLRMHARQLGGQPRSCRRRGGDRRGGSPVPAHILPGQQPLARVSVHDCRQVVDSLALLARKRARDVDQQFVVDVAAPAAAELRRTLAAQPLHRAVLRARGNAYALGRRERRHLDRGAADRLGDRDRHLDLEVVALAREDRRLAHARNHVEVSGGAVARACLALPRQSHPTAVADAAQDIHAVALDLARSPGAVAGRAGLLDLRTSAAALPAGLEDREQPLRFGLDPAALAARADRRRGARLGARPAAGRTGRRERHRDRDLCALHRLGKRDMYFGLQVAAALGASGAGAPAGVAEEVGDDVPEAAEVPAAKRVRVETAAEHAAARVIGFALLGVGQDRVRLLDLLEALLGLLVVGVGIRVVLARKLAIGLLDLLGGGLVVEAERPVGVLYRGHALYLARDHHAGRTEHGAVRAVALLDDVERESRLGAVLVAHRKGLVL